jgi:eukaryotic-like serine/threonine-protein kinase
MALPSGKRLGPYEILSAVGAGGMGVVYRARDTRLDRTVAIKVLASHLSNPDLKQRFEREARAISSLSHPNICALYDIGEQDGLDYLVMEFLEGETLEEKLQKGPLPIEQVLPYGMQIADALDKAHRQGIIHRDLKPANIMITRSGVKLLDFGLAKLQASTQPVAGVSMLPTEQRSLTAEGSIIGTLQYMSPEQLEGREADARTDLFAMGVVLYEMATGRKAFTGKSQASLIAAILSSEPPPISTIQPLTPPAFDRIVKTCLAKDPEDRWQTAHDVLLELKWVAEGGSQAGLPAPVVTRRKNRERLAWIFAGLFLLVSATLAWLYFEELQKQTGTLHVSIVPSEINNVWHSEISLDGRTLAIVGVDPNGKSSLWLRRLDADHAVQLPETGGASFPFWSPDNRYLAFFADGKLKKIEVPNGRPEILCDAPSWAGGSWSSKNGILFSNNRELYRIDPDGGKPQQVTKLDSQHEGHRWPWFLPDGVHFLYLNDANTTELHSLELGSLDSKQSYRLLTSFISSVAYARDYVYFVRFGALMAQRLDIKHFRLTGSPITVAEPMTDVYQNHRFDFSVSTNGTVAYQQRSPNSQLIWYDRTGAKIGTLGEPGKYASFDLSPDNNTVALEVLDPDFRNGNLWLVQTQRGTTSRFTFDRYWDTAPIWSVDGSTIAFGSNRSGGGFNLYLKSLANQGNEEPLFKSIEKRTDQFATSWSPDGKSLVFEIYNEDTKADIWLLPLSGDRKPVPLIHTPFFDYAATISPDGRFIAYTSEETGRPEIYVQTMPPSGKRWQVSTSGGMAPKWRKDGKEIFFIGPDNKLFAAEIRSEENFDADTPKPLFTINERFMGPERSNYAVSSDGQRFLVNTMIDTPGLKPIQLLIHWNPRGKS